MSGLCRTNMLLSAGRRRGRPVGTGRRSGNGGSRRRMALPGRGGRKRTHGIRTGRRRGRSLFRRRHRFMPHGSGNILRMSSRSGRQASGQKKKQGSRQRKNSHKRPPKSSCRSVTQKVRPSQALPHATPGKALSVHHPLPKERKTSFHQCHRGPPCGGGGGADLPWG